MLAQKWRLRFLGAAPGLVALQTLRLCNAQGPIDGAAALSCPVAPSAGVLEALIDADAETFVQFHAVDLLQSGFAIEWLFPTQVDVSTVEVQAHSLYGVALDAFIEGRWQPAFAVLRDLALSGSLRSDFMVSSVSQGDVSVAGVPGGGVGSVSSYGSAALVSSSGVGQGQMFALHVLTKSMPSILMSAYADLELRSDSAGLRHMGLWLYDAARPTFGWRVATINSNLQFSFFNGSAGYGEVVYGVSPITPIQLGVRYRFEIEIIGVTMRVYRNSVQIALFEIPFSAPAFDAKLGVFAYNGSVAVYEGGIGSLMDDGRGLSLAEVRHHPIPGEIPNGGFAHASVKSHLVQDLEFGGQAGIYGTVELYAQAGNIPLPRRVRLHRSRDGLLVREAWSDAQGNYRFDGITDRYKYDVIAWDHEGLQQSVVANDLTPEVMP